jgi:L-iditol 2-dehydrogenase
MVVIGAGPIGLMFMHVAALNGIHVIAVVKREDQRALAASFGARNIVLLDQAIDPVAAARALTPNARGADVVVEAVATPQTWEWAVAMVRRGGTVNFFGGPPSGTVVALDTNRLHYGGITLKASFHHTPATARTAFSLIASGRFKCGEYITGTALLADVPGIFARMMTRSSSTNGAADIKTAVFPTRSPQ